MADPRNAVDFAGIGYEAETFLADGVTITYDSAQPYGSAAVGLAVTLSAAGTVALAGDGELVLGRLVKVESDGKAVVQTGGYCELPGGTGATLTVGSKIVGDLLVAAPGYIRTVVAPGATYAQAEAAEAQQARHTIIDSTVATAVVVKLG